MATALTTEEAKQIRLVLRSHRDRLDLDAKKYGIELTEGDKDFLIRKLSRIPKAGSTKEHVIKQLTSRTKHLFELLASHKQ
jgi:hypothetical protein